MDANGAESFLRELDVDELLAWIASQVQGFPLEMIPIEILPNEIDPDGLSPKQAADVIRLVDKRRGWVGQDSRGAPATLRGTRVRS